MFTHPLRHLILWSVVGYATHRIVSSQGGWSKVWKKVSRSDTVRSVAKTAAKSAVKKVRA